MLKGGLVRNIISLMDNINKNLIKIVEFNQS